MSTSGKSSLVRSLVRCSASLHFSRSSSAIVAAPNSKCPCLAAASQLVQMFFTISTFFERAFRTLRTNGQSNKFIKIVFILLKHTLEFVNTKELASTAIHLDGSLDPCYRLLFMLW